MHIIKNLLLLIGSLCIILILLELGVRIFVEVKLEPHPKNLYIADPDIGYRNNPGFKCVFKSELGTGEVAINSQSLRADKEYGKKDSLTYRILLLGDSQTFAGSIPFDSTFGKVLERNLNKFYQQSHFEVLNAGVSGYSTANEAAFLQKFGPSLEPDLVIVGFYLNDILENEGGIAQKTVKDGYLISENRHVIGNPFILPYGLKKFLRTHSHLYYYITYKWDLLKGAFYSPSLELYNQAQPDYILKDWEQTYANLRSIKNWTEAKKVQLVIAYLPEADQVEDELWGAILSKKGNYDRTLPESILTEFCEKEEILLFDAYPFFFDRRNTVALFGKIDRHYSLKGNELVGQELFLFLDEHLF